MQRRPLVNLSGVRSELPTGDTLYGAGAYISDTAPLVPWEGMHWIKSDTGIEYVYYLNGGNPAWVYFGKAGIPGADGLTQSYDPITETVLFSDFLTGLTASTASGTSFASTPLYPTGYNGPGTGTSVTQVPTSVTAGLCRLNTGSSATSYPQVFLSPPCLYFAAGKLEYQARFVQRSDPTLAQDFITYYGYRDVISGASDSGIYVRGLRFTDGDGFVLAVNVGGTLTETPIPGVARPAVGVYMTVRLVIDPEAMTVEAWFDGALKLTLTLAALPAADVAPFSRFQKMAGTTSALLDIDYIYSKQTLNRPGVSDAGNGYKEGVVFPTSPSANMKFYRTDLNLLCFWDGVRWLTVQQYEVSAESTDAITPVATSNSCHGRFVVHGDEQMFVERWDSIAYVVVTNTAANFWTVNLSERTVANASTNIASYSTVSDAPSNWVAHSVEINAAVTPGVRVLQITGVKTGGPGNIYPLNRLVYRRIVT